MNGGRGGGDERSMGVFEAPLGVCFWRFLDNTSVEQLFGDNYNHVKISSILRRDFTKKTNPLKQGKFNNK